MSNIFQDKNDSQLLGGDGFNLRRLDDNLLDIKSDEVILFGCVRNEILRLPYFLQYHRSLGVDRFIFVDNASNDGSKEYLLTENDVHVFYTDESYAESRCGVDWLNLLLETFGAGHWTLTLDADELLVYPMCEQINLKVFVNYLESVQADALETFLLDMYSDKAIKDTLYTKGQPFNNSCRFFDGDNYHQLGDSGVPIRGGPRHRLFWQGKDNPKPSPVLKKFPLVKWREGLSFTASTHAITGLKLAPITGVLQHYKFFYDFISTTENETNRKEHWDNAAQYSIYWEGFRLNPGLTAYFEKSIEYVDSMQLVDLGLAFCGDDYLRFMDEQSDR